MPSTTQCLFLRSLYILKKNTEQLLKAHCKKYQSFLGHLSTIQNRVQCHNWSKTYCLQKDKLHRPWHKNMILECFSAMALTAVANVEITSAARWSHIRGLLSGLTSLPNGRKQMKRAGCSSKCWPRTSVYNMAVCNSISIPIPNMELKAIHRTVQQHFKGQF